MKIILLLTYILSCYGIIANAQDTKISGNVSDENSEPVAGANVIIKGKIAGTVTDSNGNFELNTVSGAIYISITFDQMLR